MASSHAILINSEKKLLLQLRDNKPEIWYPGYWGILGGEIEKGENPLEGLIRELQEEIPGCNIHDFSDLGSIEDNTKPLFIFKARINDSEDYINKRLTEGQRVQYFGFDELKSLKIPFFLKYFIYKNKEKIFID